MNSGLKQNVDTIIWIELDIHDCCFGCLWKIWTLSFVPEARGVVLHWHPSRPRVYCYNQQSYSSASAMTSLLVSSYRADANDYWSSILTVIQATRNHPGKGKKRCQKDRVVGFNIWMMSHIHTTKWYDKTTSQLCNLLIILFPSKPRGNLIVVEKGLLLYSYSLLLLL